MRADRRTAGLAVLGWTLVVVAFVLLNPFGQTDLLPCMQLVARTASCSAQQDALNQAVWADLTVPSIVAIGAGYLAIVVVVVGVARSRRRSN